MTDNRNETKGNVALRALGLRSKVTTTPIAPITDEELHDEAVVHALTGTRQLRKDLSEWKHKAEHTAAEFSAFKQDAAQEIMTLKHEYESKAAMLRAKIEAQDGMLKETGRKLEHYERLSYELGTKCEDIEKFYLNELRSIRDAATHTMMSQLSGVNNATIALNEATKHSGEGLLKQVDNSATNMIVFLDDLKKRRSTGEYRPKPTPPVEQKPMTPDDEEALGKLVEQFKARPHEAENEPEQG